MLELFSNFFILSLNDFQHNKYTSVYYLKDDSIENICKKSIETWKNLEIVCIIYEDIKDAHMFYDYIMYTYGKQQKRSGINDLKILNQCILFE